MKTHTEENIKYCNTCGKRFKRVDHFNKHVSNCDTSNLNSDSDSAFDSSAQEVPASVSNENLPSFVDVTKLPLMLNLILIQYLQLLLVMNL